MPAKSKGNTLRVYNRYTRNDLNQHVDITYSDFFKGFDWRAQVADPAQQVDRDPRYLLPNVFQGPRAIRLAVHFMF